MATYVRKSILALFLVLLTAVAGTNFAKNVPAASTPHCHAGQPAAVAIQPSRSRPPVGTHGIEFGRDYTLGSRPIGALEIEPFRL